MEAKEWSRIMEPRLTGEENGPIFQQPMQP